MTTMALTVAAIRKILNDNPDKIQLDQAISSTTDETIYPVSADFGKIGLGNILEHDDGAAGAELRRVVLTDSTNVNANAERGFGNSTAAPHLDATYLLKDPRFYYNTVAQAVNTVLDVDLFQEGVFEIQEHQITSSATSVTYNAPFTSCEEFLAVYQKTAEMVEPIRVYDFSRLPTNVDSTLYANGRYFRILQNFGVAGTDLYYVNCKHKLAVGTLSSTQERIVQWLACAYLLEWTEPRRTAGPTNQGDRTVRPGQGIATSAYYRTLADKAIANERSYLKALNPPVKTFRRV